MKHMRMLPIVKWTRWTVSSSKESKRNRGCIHLVKLHTRTIQDECTGWEIACGSTFFYCCRCMRFLLQGCHGDSIFKLSMWRLPNMVGLDKTYLFCMNKKDLYKNSNRQLGRANNWILGAWSISDRRLVDKISKSLIKLNTNNNKKQPHQNWREKLNRQFLKEDKKMAEGVLKSTFYHQETYQNNNMKSPHFIGNGTHQNMETTTAGGDEIYKKVTSFIIGWNVVWLSLFRK